MINDEISNRAALISEVHVAKAIFKKILKANTKVACKGKTTWWT